MDKRSGTGLFGASSLVGECVLPLLTSDGRHAFAFSRKASDCTSEGGVTWVHLDKLPLPPVSFAQGGEGIAHWLCLAPIWVLPQYFVLFEAYGARRVVALSSTSRFTKTDSSDPTENAVAERLADGEERLQAWAISKGIEWIILRPTLIYGGGHDKNISDIARFIRCLGFFPLFGRASGLRQPVHAEDVAAACVAAFNASVAANRAYNISGGETLTYREMICRVFVAMGCRARLLILPLWVFRFAIRLLRLLPRYRHWSAAMAERMNHDLVFEHADAVRDLNFSPRPFQLTAKDLPL